MSTYTPEERKILAELLRSFDKAEYPESFLNEYTLMECLSSRPGVETFLVVNKEGVPFAAKCCSREAWSLRGGADILSGLNHPGLAEYAGTFENEFTIVTVREYIEGTSLDRYALENDLSRDEIIRICAEICDILSYLHHRDEPVIHRDINPQNIIIRPDGSPVLIDFDIARVYREGSDTDTIFFGTRAYAPPEQYGFSQTDARTDIYSLGILLRWLLTGSTRQMRNVKLYRPLEKIIDKCTAFSPKERYSDVLQVKRELLAANPRAQGIRLAKRACAGVLAAILLIAAGVQIYRTATYTPFTDDAIPAVLNDEERIEDAKIYMEQKYHTDLFANPDSEATIGLLRHVLTDIYGLDHDYVYAVNKDIPLESDEFFLPWGWDDAQFVDRNVCLYAAVKVQDPSIVADWSSIKDDNGYYPGVRVAEAFAEKTGILTGANRPLDITVGEMALIFANTERVFDAA